jgi:hypothetical protein
VRFSSISETHWLAMTRRPGFRWCCADVYGSVHGRWANRRILLGTRICLSARSFSTGSNPITPFGRWRPRSGIVRRVPVARRGISEGARRSVPRADLRHGEAGSANGSSSGSAARPLHAPGDAAARTRYTSRSSQRSARAPRLVERGDKTRDPPRREFNPAVNRTTKGNSYKRATARTA